MTPQRLFSIRELAEHVGRSQAFIRKAIKSGLLAYHRVVAGGRIYVTLEQWNDYLDQTLVEGGGGAGATGSISSRRRQITRRPQKRQTVKPRRDPTAYSEIEF